jgi:transcriptional regulator with XRE-family HTH domain
MAVRVKRCRLRELLVYANLTQNELADMVGRPKSQINDYVTNDKVMSLRVAKEIADALRVTIDELYEWEYDK